MNLELYKETIYDSHEIEARVTCEKTDASLWTCFEYESSNELNDLLKDSTWVYEGISEYFWENHWEFEEEIDEAIQLTEINSSLSFKQALFNVFGSFSISFEIEEKPISPMFSIDINNLMYDLLTQ